MSANVSDPRAKAMAASRQLQEALLSASDALKTIAGIVPRLFPPNDSGSLGALLVANSTEIGRTDASGTTPSSHKRKRKEKDPDAPDKPPSAYHIYAKEKRDEIKEALGGAPSAADVIQEINRRWKELADDLKKPFNDAADKLKEKFKKEMENYEGTKGGNSEETRAPKTSSKSTDTSPIIKTKTTPAKGGFTAVKASPLVVQPGNESESESESQDEAAVATDLGGSHRPSVSPAKRQRKESAKKIDSASAKEPKDKPKEKPKEKEKEKEKKKRRKSGKSEI